MKFQTKMIQYPSPQIILLNTYLWSQYGNGAYSVWPDIGRWQVIYHQLESKLTLLFNNIPNILCILLQWIVFLTKNLCNPLILQAKKPSIPKMISVTIKSYVIFLFSSLHRRPHFLAPLLTVWLNQHNGNKSLFCATKVKSTNIILSSFSVLLQWMLFWKLKWIPEWTICM